MQELFRTIQTEYQSWYDFMREEVNFRMGEDSAFHGMDHCARVLRYALMIAKVKGLTMHQRDTLGAAAVFHDSRRDSEGRDIGHGQRAAEYYRSFCRHTGMPFDTVTFEIMAWHDHSTAHGISEIERACPDRNDAILLYKIFKDADGLDRLRLGRDELDVDRLRTAEAKELYGYALEQSCNCEV